MKPIPISAAKRIAEAYGYDQVVVVARKVDGGEHCTTYGIDKANCDVAARIGNFFKFNLMKWTGKCDCSAHIQKLEALAQWCKPDEHSPPEHWTAYRACFPDDASAERPQPCEMCGDAPCQGCNKCCGSKLGRDPEDGSCLGCG